MKNLPDLYAFLIHAARVKENPAQLLRLQEAASKISDWGELARLAELHSIAPLVYKHIQAAQIPIPDAVLQILKGRHLQHAHANRVRTQALVEILDAFQKAGIPLIVLKGMAMAHLVYPSPSLRPMSDIDLLVSKADAQAGQEIVKALGYRVPAVHDTPEDHHHLPALQDHREGVTLSIELHYNLTRALTPETSFDALYPRAQEFTLAGMPANALSHENLLAHTYHHFIDASVQPFRLIWLADMVSLVERYADQVDWENLPLPIYNALKVIASLTPFTGLPQKEPVKPMLPAKQRELALQGWPFSVIPSENQAEHTKNAAHAFCPSNWWVRLYFGMPPEKSVFAAKLFYPFHLFWGIFRVRGQAHILQRIEAYFNF